MRLTFLFVVALSGCSLLTPFDDECSSSADCSSGLQCIDNLCVRGEGAGGAGGVGGVGGAGGAGGMGGAPAGFVLTEELCHTVYGVPEEDALSEDTYLIGVLLPRTGQLGPFGPPIAQAVYLAIDEMNQVGGANGKRFAAVTCDTGTSEEQSVTAAQWLVDNAKVSAIIGPASSSNLIRVATDVTVQNNVLLISPSATAPAITDLPDQGLVWRTVPSDAFQGAAIGAHLLAQDFQKVAVVVRDDTYGNGLRDAIQEAYCGADRCDEERYFVRSYASEGTADAQSRILFALDDFMADVVVLIAFFDDGVSFLNLAAAAGVENFILTDGTKDEKMLMAVESEPILRGVLGTAPSSPTGENFAEFRLNYTSKWGSEPGVFNAQAYDAMYLLGYAYGGFTGDNVGGRDLAIQLRRLSAGAAIAVGNAEWNRALRALQSNDEATIDFQGASGPLDFNNQGEAPSDIEGWRFDVDEQRIRTLGVIYTATGDYMAPPAE